MKKKSATKIVSIVLAVLLILSFLCALQRWGCSTEDFNDRVSKNTLPTVASFVFCIVLALLIAWDCMDNPIFYVPEYRIENPYDKETSLGSADLSSSRAIEELIVSLVRFDRILLLLILIATAAFQIYSPRGLKGILGIIAVIVLIISICSVIRSMISRDIVIFEKEKVLTSKHEKELSSAPIKAFATVIYTLLYLGTLAYFVFGTR